jgi:hypothetical protein
MKYYDRLAEAWRSLDRDLSGFISLHELDPESHKVLSAFKLWSERHFGGVRDCFHWLDSDNDQSLSLMEFRRAVREWGGLSLNDVQMKMLFKCLTCDDLGGVTAKDVVFLETWGTDEIEEYTPIVPGAKRFAIVSHINSRALGKKETTFHTKRTGGNCDEVMRETKVLAVHPQFAFTKGPMEYEKLKSATLSHQGAYIMGSLKTPKFPWLPKLDQSAQKALISPYSMELRPRGSKKPKRRGDELKSSHLGKTVSLPNLNSNKKAI